MASDVYAGEYAKFFAVQTDGVDFMGADNLVGDKYEIDIRDEEGGYKAYLVNRFGKDIGYLENRMIRPVQLAQAKGWKTDAFLSFVAFTQGKDADNPSYYWGQMAVLCYDPKISDAITTFEQKLSEKMADGARPQVDFGVQSVEKLLASPDTWFPSDKAAQPKMGNGSTIMKDHRTTNERLIEESRKGNKGCYVLSWAFIIAVVALIIWIIHSCGVF